MDRRGDLTWDTIGKAVMTLLAIALLAWLVLLVAGGTKKSLVCTENEGYVCRSIIGGCEDDEEWSMLSPLGCGARICCGPKDEGGGGPGTGNQEYIPAMTLKAANADTKRELVPGQSVVVLPGEQARIEFSGTTPKCDGCVWDWDWTLSTRTASIASKAQPGSPPYVAFPADFTITSDKDVEKAFESGAVVFNVPQAYSEETLTFTLIVTPTRGGEAAGQTRTYTLHFKVTPAIRYSGLSQAWSQQKPIIAACERNVKCSGIYYEIVADPASCDAGAASRFSDARNITTQYCAVRGAERQGCYPTVRECLDATDRLTPQSNTATEAIKAAVKSGLLTDAEVLQLLQAQPADSSYTCIADVKSVADWQGVIFRPDTFDPETQRATFLLDKPFMTNQYLCVYGQDAHNPLRSFVAGPPRQIRIDRTPPVAKVEFRPSTLMLRFECQDGESGCRQAFGTAYIGDITKYFPALLGGRGQSAEVWCPAYRSAGGYVLETRPEVRYSGDAVRVLCLRVEDNAGNAGVAMTTVFNAYDQAIKLLVMAGGQ